MNDKVEYRQLECTDCTHRRSEQGAPIDNLRPGDVTMRVCSECGVQTVHILVLKRLVKNIEVKGAA